MVWPGGSPAKVRSIRKSPLKIPVSMTRGKISDGNPADWFAFAAERWHAAEVLAATRGVESAAAGLLPDSGERYLKDCLIAPGRTRIKTDDLEILLRSATSYDPAFARFAELAFELPEKLPFAAPSWWRYGHVGRRLPEPGDPVRQSARINPAQSPSIL